MELATLIATRQSALYVLQALQQSLASRRISVHLVWLGELCWMGRYVEKMQTLHSHAHMG